MVATTQEFAADEKVYTTYALEKAAVGPLFFEPTLINCC